MRLPNLRQVFILRQIAIMVILISLIAFFVLLVSNYNLDTIEKNYLALCIIFSFVLVSTFIKYLTEKRGYDPPWLVSWFGDLSTEFTGALILGFLFFFLLTVPV